MRAEFEPLMKYLSDSIGQKVTLYIAKDYGDLRTQMEAGTVDIGSFSPKKIDQVVYGVFGGGAILYGATHSLYNSVPFAMLLIMALLSRPPRTA